MDALHPIHRDSIPFTGALITPRDLVHKRMPSEVCLQPSTNNLFIIIYIRVIYNTFMKVASPVLSSNN